jgi:gamma-glutamylcyclotransferase (GGCT)/AIG2-like uncharacterized protein YtfP
MSRTVNVFAYGTLQISEVMRAVTGGEYPAQPARLEGYARYCLAGRSYPGLRLEPGAETVGTLYSQVDAEALRRLDEFEDDFYRRETLPVITESGPAVPAEVYVIPPAHYALLIGRSWDLEEFRRTGLREFMARCRAGW